MINWYSGVSLFLLGLVIGMEISFRRMVAHLKKEDEKRKAAGKG